MGEDRADRILNAALEAIMEHGSSKVSLEDVGRRIGVSKSAIYHYFPNKQEMIRAVFVREINRMQATMEAAVAHASDPEAKLRALFKARFDFMNRKGGPNSWSLETLFDIEPHTRALLPILRGAEEDLIAGVLRQGMESGHFEAADPAIAASVLVSCLHGFQENFLMVPKERTRKERLGAFTRLILEGLLARPAAEE